MLEVVIPQPRSMPRLHAHGEQRPVLPGQSSIVAGVSPAVDEAQAVKGAHVLVEGHTGDAEVNRQQLDGVMEGHLRGCDRLPTHRQDIDGQGMKSPVDGLCCGL